MKYFLTKNYVSYGTDYWNHFLDKSSYQVSNIKFNALERIFLNLWDLFSSGSVRALRQY